MPDDRINQCIVLKDGRHLGFAEYGVPTGHPVFHFHGSGSSRLDHPLPESILTRLNVRFLSVDRPGNGLSDFQPRRRLIDWGKDIEQLADQLGSHQFYVVGHSAGGPHALACAYLLPERVIAGAVISSVAPMSRPDPYKGMPVLNQLLARSARRFPWITEIMRWSTRHMVMGDMDKASRRILSSLPNADKAVLYDPQNFEIFASAVREGFRTGSRGVAQDDTLINQEWGFDLACISPRIDIWHGEADVNVPVHAARYLQDRLPHTRMTILPGEGHFFLLNHWEQILLALVYGK